MYLKNVIRKVINMIGYDVVKFERAKSVNRLKNVSDQYLEILDANPQLFGGYENQEKLYTTFCAIKYIVENDIPGDLVECGVYKGRMIAMMCVTLLSLGVTDRKIYLFDTFKGMVGLSENDYKLNREGYTYSYNMSRQRSMQREGYNLRCFSPTDSVKEYLLKTGYPEEMLIFVEGDVVDTIPTEKINEISFLRLDTDWYISTKHELDNLYPLLTAGGVFVQDDYGSWAGAKKAVDEYFFENDDSPILFRMGNSEVATIKL